MESLFNKEYAHRKKETSALGKYVHMLYAAKIVSKPCGLTVHYAKKNMTSFYKHIWKYL